MEILSYLKTYVQMHYHAMMQKTSQGIMHVNKQ